MLKNLGLIVFLISLSTSIARANEVDTNRIDEMVLEAYYLQSSDIDSSYQLANEILDQSGKINYKKGMASAYMRMGSILNAWGRNDSALILLRRAYLLRLDLKAYKGAAGTCLVMNYIYQQTAQIDSAYYVLFEALRLNSLIKDSVGLAKINNNLGALSASYGELEDAFLYYKKGQKLSLESNYREGFAISLSGLGNFHYQEGSYALALKKFLKADSVYMILGNQLNLARNANNLALCYDQLNDFEEAKKNYEKALRVYKILNSERETALTIFNLGVLLDNDGQADSAIVYFHQALPFLRNLEDLQLVSLSYKQLAKAHSKQGEYDLAYDYHQKFSNLRDSILNQEKISSISEMQTKYDTEKKEQRILLLGEQNKTRSAQRNFFIAGSLVLLLGLFILAYYYWQKRRLAAKNEELAKQRIEGLLNEQEIKSFNALIKGQEEERQRIATDLHDRLGSMLSTVKLLFSALDSKFDKKDSDGKNQYDKATNLLDESCEEVRRVSHNLSTGMVSSLGLQTALKELCDGIDQSGLIQCKLLIYGLEERLDNQTEIGIYRIIQESLNNALKHSKASNVTVQLNCLEDSLSITIEDNGIGFDPKKIKENMGGMGLSNLEMRAKKLKGSFHIDSSPGKGSISMIDIPLIQHET